MLITAVFDDDMSQESMSKVSTRRSLALDVIIDAVSVDILTCGVDSIVSFVIDLLTFGFDQVHDVGK